MADVDLDCGCTLNNKIRNAQLAQYNFIFGNLNLYIFSQMLFFSTLIPPPKKTLTKKERIWYNCLIMNT